MCLVYNNWMLYRNNINLLHVYYKDQIIHVISTHNDDELWHVTMRGSTWWNTWFQKPTPRFYDYLCNQCLSPLMLWIQIPLRQGVIDTTSCDKSLSVTCDTVWWFSPVSYTNKTDLHNVTAILLKVPLNTINQSIQPTFLLLSLGRYLCWWTISPRGYHQPSSRCFHTHMVYW